jgi:hypothetical protein
MLELRERKTRQGCPINTFVGTIWDIVTNDTAAIGGYFIVTVGLVGCPTVAFLPWAAYRLFF